MRQSRAAYRAECDVEFQYNAKASAARAITDVAHESRVFSTADVYGRMHVDNFTERAFTTLIDKAARTGAVLALGADRWEVVDEDGLCDAVYSHAA